MNQNNSFYFVFYERNLILLKDFSFLSFEDFSYIRDSQNVSFYFEEEQNNIFALELTSTENLSDNFSQITLRDFYATHSEDENFKTFRAKSLLEWHKNTVFLDYASF